MKSLKITITKKLLVFIFFLLSTTTYGQITPGATSLDWFTHAGNSVDMQPSGGNAYLNKGMGITTDELGNIYTIGMFWGTIHFGSYTLTTGTIFNQGSHCYITKQDPAGNYIWAIKTGGYPGGVSDYYSLTTKENHITHMIAIKNGSIYVCGMSNYPNIDFNPSPGVNTLPNGVKTGYILKLDTAGNFNWVKEVTPTPGSTNGTFTMLSGIGADNSGNCYVVGHGFRTDSLVLGTKVVQNSGPNPADNSDCIFYAKLDSYGNCDWLRISHTNFNERMFVEKHSGYSDIAVTPNGTVYICSPFMHDFKLKTGPSSYKNFYWHQGWGQTFTNYSDMMLAKVNSNGWVTWGTNWGAIYSPNLTTSEASCNPNLRGCSMAYNPTVDKLVLKGSFGGYAGFINTNGVGIDTIIDAQNNPTYSGVNLKYGGQGIYMISYDVSTPTPSRDWIKNFIGGPPTHNGPQYAKNIAMDNLGNVYITDLQIGKKMDYTPNLPSTPVLPQFVVTGLAKYDINGNFKWLTYAEAPNNEDFRMLSIAISPCNNKVYTTGFFKGLHDVDPSTSTHNISSFANPPTGVVQTDAFTWALNQDNVSNPITITSGYNGPLCVGQFLQLNASASGAVSYKWTGPNGFTSAQQNPGFGSIAAADAGDYIVTVRNAVGCSNKDTVHVSIGLFPPNAGTLSSPSVSVCSGATLNVTTNGNSGGTWQIVNAGGTATINSSGVVTGGSPGSVVVRYIDTKSCGSDTATLNLQINQQPNAGTLSGPISVCLNGTTSFSTNGDPGGSWSIINNTGSAVVNNAGVVTGISAGFVTVQYVVSNLCGTDTTSKNLMIIDLPNAGTITGPSSVCKGDSVQLSTNGSGGGTWSSSNPFGAYPQPSGEVLGNIPGNYTISYTVNNSCGSDVATYQITVNNSADAGIISGADTVCIGSIFTYTSTGNAGGAWFSNNGNININSTGEVTGLTAGTSVISYIVNNTCGQDTATKVVTVVNLPNAGQISGPSASVCINNSLQLTTNGDAGGVWTTSNSNCSVDSTGMVTGLFQGTCIVEYIVSSACGSDTAQYAITINTKGQKVINNYTECEGFSVTVNGNTYDSTGTYTDYVGCDTIITQLQIVPNPELILSKQDAVCDQNNGQAIANGSSQYPPISYLWNNNSTDSILSNLDPGIYTVIITDSMGCTNTGTVTIDNLTKDCGYVVSIPGAFTPNGDGNNDLLMVSGKGIKSLDFKVFNRWGNLVFETTSPNEGWDGVYRGKKQNTAVFMYTLKVTFKNGKTVTKTGDVGLIR